VIWAAVQSTDAVVRLLGGDPGSQRETITEEELRGMVAAHESLTKDERKLIDDVFAAGERQLREVMLPRTEVAFLDASMTLSRAITQTAEQPHSRYPVAGSSQDDVLGFLHVRDLMVPAAKARGMRVADVVREVKMLPGSKRVLPAMSEMRREGHHMAIVVDEYGGTAGIVTLEDLIEEVIGDIRDEYDVARPTRCASVAATSQADGLPQPRRGAHGDRGDAAGGPVRDPRRVRDGPAWGHVPRTGEAVEVDGHRLR
jgi:putative hemolysin